MKKTTVNRFDAKFPKARPGDLCDGVGTLAAARAFAREMGS